jgi:hypothetical protein
MGEGNSTYREYSGCPYLTTEEDHWQTTSYPKCSCGCRHCNEYNGYCPIKDDA